MSDRDKLRLMRVWETGHFRNPAYPDTFNVTASDIYEGRVDINDGEARQAIRSWQEMHKAALDEWIPHFHPERSWSTGLVVDGEFGEASDVVASLDPIPGRTFHFQRCGVPDHGTPVKYHDTGRIDFAEGAAEEANWPKECRGDLSIAWDLRRLRGMTQDEFARSMRRAMRNWMDEIDVGFREMSEWHDGDQRKANFWAEGQNFPGSKLAHHYLAQNRCGVKLEGNYDTGQIWSDTLFSATATHEIGHGLGARHDPNNAATMYFAITNTSKARRGALHEADKRQMVRLGYKREPLEPRPDDPPDEPGSIWDYIEIDMTVRDTRNGLSGDGITGPKFQG